MATRRDPKDVELELDNLLSKSDEDAALALIHKELWPQNDRAYVNAYIANVCAKHKFHKGLEVFASHKLECETAIRIACNLQDIEAIWIMIFKDRFYQKVVTSFISSENTKFIEFLLTSCDRNSIDEGKLKELMDILSKLYVNSPGHFLLQNDVDLAMLMLERAVRENCGGSVCIANIRDDMDSYYLIKLAVIEEIMRLYPECFPYFPSYQKCRWIFQCDHREYISRLTDNDFLNSMRAAAGVGDLDYIRRNITRLTTDVVINATRPSRHYNGPNSVADAKYEIFLEFTHECTSEYRLNDILDALDIEVYTCNLRISSGSLYYSPISMIGHENEDSRFVEKYLQTEMDFNYNFNYLMNAIIHSISNQYTINAVKILLEVCLNKTSCEEAFFESIYRNNHVSYMTLIFNSGAIDPEIVYNKYEFVDGFYNGPEEVETVYNCIINWKLNNSAKFFKDLDIDINIPDS